MEEGPVYNCRVVNVSENVAHFDHLPTRVEGRSPFAALQSAAYVNARNVFHLTLKLGCHVSVAASKERPPTFSGHWF